MYLDEYEKLVIRMSTPRVVIDNAVCPTATLVKVDSARKHGFLLEAVQVLTDLDLSINKAYISSDGRWFMDVFHVTDRHGQKLTDDKVLSYIERSLEAVDHLSSQSNGGQEAHLTPLELSAADRPGLLSEVFAVLADLRCGVADARVWTHAGRIAMVVQVRDEESGGAIEDERKILGVEARLRHVIKGDRVRVFGAGGAAGHAERRLHQMMVEDRDYERTAEMEGEEEPAVSVSVQNWVERGYSVVTAVSRDRPKLLFDVMCTLTDMEYVVFHGTIDTDGDRARQEFYVRHKDGSPISSEAERHRVILCLQAAIERRASEGLRLELCTTDRRGLLSEVTRTFRENGLMVARAEISTKGQTASNVFYVTDAAGQRPDLDLVESVRQRVGPACLQVVEEPRPRFHRKALAAPDAAAGAGLFSLGSLVLRNLYNLGLIRSCS